MLEKVARSARNNRVAFRCWHAQHETMFEVFEIHDGRPSIIRNPKNRNTLLVSEPELDFIRMMQYTGINDRDGKMLYDGDVYRHAGTYRAGQYGEVTQDSGAWVGRYNTPNEDGQVLDFLSSISSEVECIGHVFQRSKPWQQNTQD